MVSIYELSLLIVELIAHHLSIVIVVVTMFFVFLMFGLVGLFMFWGLVVMMTVKRELIFAPHSPMSVDCAA